jgi:hypothetical protein
MDGHVLFEIAVVGENFLTKWHGAPDDFQGIGLLFLGLCREAERVTILSVVTDFVLVSGGSRNFEKGGGPAPKRGGPPPEIEKKITYYGSQILSFTNIRW